MYSPSPSAPRDFSRELHASRSHPVVIPVQAGIQGMDIGLRRYDEEKRSSGALSMYSPLLGNLELMHDLLPRGVGRAGETVESGPRALRAPRQRREPAEPRQNARDRQVNDCGDQSACADVSETSLPTVSEMEAPQHGERRPEQAAQQRRQRVRAGTAEQEETVERGRHAQHEEAGEQRAQRDARGAEGEQRGGRSRPGATEQPSRTDGERGQHAQDDDAGPDRQAGLQSQGFLSALVADGVGDVLS